MKKDLTEIIFVLSAPIYDPDRGEDLPLLGTLQVDSDLPMEEVRFNTEWARGTIECFSEALSPLLKIGG